MDKKLQFTLDLMQWNKKINSRQMPWKNEKDPYKIWLSEIMLQQTRVEQGWDYYNKFVAAFPAVKNLANAPETKVFKLWEGLGYYSRCKNLIATAKFIHTEYSGIFPNDYESILKLKGIGPYTAAAIASFAFNLPYAVVDGNVFRVLARYFNNDTPIDSTKGRLLFTKLANELLDKKKPGSYNQAIMDFGAVVCKPKLPNCVDCVLKLNCMAFKKNTVNHLPVKEKKLIQKTRWFNYIIIENKGKILVQKRGPKDIWENLHQFFLIETPEKLNWKKIPLPENIKNILKTNEYTAPEISNWYKQKLTHQTINAQFIRISFENKMELAGFQNVTQKQLLALPLPKLIISYLKDKNVSLNL